MSYTQQRNTTAMIGTPASPSSLAANASTAFAATLDLTQTNGGNGGVAAASVVAALISGVSAPTTAVVLQYQFTHDAANWVQDGPAVSLTMAPSTTYYFRYDPPLAAKGARVAVTNGATNAIQVWEQGNALVESS